MSRAIVLLSGGIDSATTLYWAIDQGFEVIALTFNYHGRAQQEVKAARKIAQYTGVQHTEIKLPFLETAADIQKKEPGAFKGRNLPEGYIPTRNLIFYALATYYAEIYKAHYIIAGHLMTDAIGFPDATPKFFHDMEQLINSTQLNSIHGINIHILLPFLKKTKSEVIKMATQLKVPIEMTWSCYYDMGEHCENCESCWERADAFNEAGIIDPLKHYFCS